jgi:hypothetical protein
VTFAPTANGLQTDSIDFGYNDGVSVQSVSRPIQGTGATPATLTLSAATHSFGSQPIGSGTDFTITVTYAGGVAATGVNGIGLAAPFDFKGGTFPGTGGTCGASVSANCTIVVRYSPTALGAHNDTLTVQYNDGAANQSVSIDLDGTGVSTAVLAISNSNYNFGNKPTGSSTDFTFTITNSGTTTATSMSGSGLAAPFTFKGGSYPGVGGTCGATLAGGGTTCTIVVTYAPATAAVHSDTIDISYDNGVTTTTASNTIQGTGQSPASLAISNSGYDYGSKSTGSSADFTFTVTNSGSTTASAMSGGGLAAPFTFKGGTYPGAGGTCGPTLTGGGTTCTIVVTYAPTTTGLHTDTIDISYNDGVAVQTASNNIQGTGLSPAVLAITGAPAAYDYGNQAVGSSTIATFTVSNTGGSTATSLAGAGLAAPFTYTGGSFPGGGTCGTTLAAGASCTFKVTYNPAATITSNDTIDITYNDGAASQTASRDVQGTGVTTGLLTISDGATYNYGSAVAGGGTVDHIFTITKAGSADATSVTETTLAAPFTFAGGSYPGTGGTCGTTITANCTIVVRFAPAAAGAISGTITLSYNNGAGTVTATRALSGVGSSPASISMSDTDPYDYGIVLNGFSADKTITLTNNGGVTAVSMSGSGLAAPYSFKGGTYPGTTGTCGATLASLASCTIVLTFAPSATATFTDAADISFNNGVAATTSSKNLTGKGYVNAATLALQVPATSPNNNPTPTIRVSGLISGLGVQLHTNNTCTALVGSTTASAATADIVSSALSDATWNFYAKVTDTYGNGSCAAATVTYALDTTAPANPTGWTLTSPSNGTISNDNTPIVNGTGIAGEDGSTAKLYSDPSCSTNIDNAVISAGSFSMTGISYATDGTADGVKTYYGRIVDQFGNQSGCVNLGLSYTFDRTAPNPATSVTTSASWTNIASTANVTPSFSWTASTSPDLNRYEVGLHTSAAGGNAAGGWTSVGTSTSTTMTGLAALTECTNYYPTVRAIDTAGNISTLAVGAPFKYDGTAPTQPGAIVLGTDMSKSKSPTATWTASTEACSFDHYEIALGTTAGGGEVVNWTNIGNVLTYQFTGQNLTRGVPYFISVRAVDTAGNVSTVRTSAAFVPPLPTLDGAWEEQTSGTTPSHDHLAGGTGKNRILVATVYIKDNASNDITVMTWGGVAMTQAAERETTDGTTYYRVETWYMKEASLATVAVANTIPFTVTYATVP